MPLSRPKLVTPPTPQQTAEYTHDMLVALKTMAADRGQETLVALLAAAAAEARSLAQSPSNGGERA
jgi:hypothetical protein